MPLYCSPGQHRLALVTATKVAKDLLSACYRAKDECSALPEYHCCPWDLRISFANMAQLCRDFFLSDDFLCLKAWEEVPVLQLWLAVQDATRPPRVADWNTNTIEKAVSAFTEAWTVSVPDSSRHQQPTEVPAEPDEVAALPDRLKQTYLACAAAVEGLSQRIPEEEITKKHVWDWLKEHTSGGYRLPKFDTWTRYLRDIPQVFEKQKRRSRVPLISRSVVRKRDL